MRFTDSVLVQFVCEFFCDTNQSDLIYWNKTLNAIKSIFCIIWDVETVKDQKFKDVLNLRIQYNETAQELLYNLTTEMSSFNITKW